MNTVEVIDAVKERLDRARELLPPDVKVEVIQDQSRYIRAALHEIQNHLIAGSILASLIVLLFMRSWRSTLIAAVAIPASIIGTFAVMKAFGLHAEQRHDAGPGADGRRGDRRRDRRAGERLSLIEEKGLPPMQAAIEGTREIGLAVLATTLSLVIVFLPVSFLSSVTGRMLFRVRHHGHRGDHDLDAGQLLAHADDVQPDAAAGAQLTRRRQRRPGLAPRLLSLDRRRLHVVPAAVDAVPLGGAAAGRSR